MDKKALKQSGSQHGLLLPDQSGEGFVMMSTYCPQTDGKTVQNRREINELKPRGDDGKVR